MALVAAVLVLSSGGASAAPASKQAGRKVWGHGSGGGRVVVGASRPGTAGPAQRPAPRPRPAAAPAPVPDRRIRSIGGISFVLDPCLTIVSGGVIVPDPTAPGCGPSTPGRPAPRRPAAADLAREAVRAVDLPRPEPWIAPGEAITGLRAYLEIGGVRLDTPVVDLDGVLVRLDARVVDYDVDWGDGTPVRTRVVSRGGPWPAGDVSHVYERAGAYDVQVRARWRVEWSTQGESGVIAEPLATTGIIAGFPVGEIQAIVGR